MRKKKIITVTLNPSLDRTIVTHYLSLGYHNHVSDTTRLHPAGRGVNIARALYSLGIPAHAIVVLADDPNGAAFRRLLQQEAMGASFVFHRGTTRSNVTILDTGNQQETHIVERSGGLTPEVINAVADALEEQAEPGDYVVFAGSLPDDSPADTYGRMVERVREHGAIVGVSVTPEAQDLAITAIPNLLAVNQNELERYFNHPVRTENDVLYCGRKLLDTGIEEVLIIRPEGHAVLMTTQGTWHMTYNEEIVGTHTGVKEAVLAGYMAGQAEGMPTDQALELGGAAAVYTSGQIGSVYGSLEEIRECASEVTVTASQDESDEKGETSA
ncbi:MAG: hypothetical protein JXN59_03920 [Anaerolineae bacterium]|nr:hypothetical protein [Anaerolineae bacterium]